MKQYNLANLVTETQTSLISYLASSLPIGNHTNQEKLGERFHTIWGKTTFKGPYLETVPNYETTASLAQLFSEENTTRPQDKLFANLLRPRYQRQDIDTRFRDFRRARSQLWEYPYLECRQSIEQLWNRPLYVHQEQALRIAVETHDNLVVATGTGSGKTECFILPILYELLTEPSHVRTVPGVRALLLYPMNALVEDQMARLRRVLFWLNLCAFDTSLRESQLARPITFGRYTGETPVESSDRSPDRSMSQEEIHELGELLYRKDMQATPPDILVTNFTMLEYMLLRNDDKHLFHNPSLFKFLVLDEVHTYHGTRGMEVATLLVRLRDFLSRRLAGEPPRYVCIGTSATLGSGEHARSAMAQFATRLFGSRFKPENVLAGHTKAPSTDELSHRPFNRERSLKEILNLTALAPSLCRFFAVTEDRVPWEGGDIEEEEWHNLALVLESSFIPTRQIFDQNLERTELLGRIVSASPAFRVVKEAVQTSENNVVTFAELAKRLFGESLFNTRPQDCCRALSRLIQLVMGGSVDDEDLLSLRAHLFAKEHTNGFLCINPSHTVARMAETDGWWAELYVHHRTTCLECRSLVYPVLLCRKCGFVVLEGWLKQGEKKVLPEKDELLGQGQFSRILFRSLNSLTERLRERLSSESECKTVTLCTLCGQRMFSNLEEDLAQAIDKHGQQCPPQYLVQVAEWAAYKQDYVLSECPYCEQQWFKGQEVVTHPRLSLYAAASVLLEEIKRGIDEPLWGTGRVNKILCFSDGRQQAAYIASRLQRTNEDFTFRQLLYKHLADCESGSFIKSVISGLTAIVSDNDALVELFCEREERDDEFSIRRRIATLLFRETCTEYRTLEALGLCSLSYAAEIYGRATQYFSTQPIVKDMSLEEQRAFVDSLLDWGFRFHRWALHAGTEQPFFDELERYGYYDKAVSKFGSSHANVAGFSLRRADSRSRLFDFFHRIAVRHGASPFDDTLATFKGLMEGFWNAVLACPDLIARHTTGGPLRQQKPLVLVAGTETDSLQLKLNWSSLQWQLRKDESVVHRCDTCGYVSENSVLNVCPVRGCNGRLRETTITDIIERPFSPTRHYLRLLRDKPPKPLRIEEHTAQISSLRRREIEAEFKTDDEGSIDIISGSTTFELGVDLGGVNAVFLANMPPEPSNYRQRAGRAGRRSGMLPFVVTYVREKPHDTYFWNQPEYFIAGPLRVPTFSAPSHEVVLRHANALLFSFLLQENPSPSRLQGPPVNEFVNYILGDAKKRDLNALLGQPNSDLTRGLQKVLSSNPAISMTPLECLKKFYDRVEHFASSYSDLYTDEGAISIFSDYGILPSYNYPIYVDELRLYEHPRSEWPRNSLKLQRDRSIALTEYYPGRIIVAGKLPIRSIGLWGGYKTLPFLYCRECSYIDTRRPGEASSVCPHGCGTLQRQVGVKPVGGFIGEPEFRLRRQDPELFGIARGQYLFDPAGNPPPPLSDYGRALRAARQSSFNIEKSGARMRTFSPRPDSSQPLKLEKARLRDVATARRAPTECLVVAGMGNGQAEQLYLMHEFTTDILRIQVRANRVGQCVLTSAAYSRVQHQNDEGEKKKAQTILVWSLSQALCTAAARLLQIDPRELGFTFRFSPGDTLLSREIILFDTAPGGAGYCDQVFERLQELFETAVKVLECPNDCEDSCYSCLRSFDNQVFHSRLNRHYVLEGLMRFNQENW